MKTIAKAIIAYGAFLILAGLVGYLSNPEKAKTALASGGTFGLLNIGWGILALRGWRPAPKAALITAGLLALVFTWRSTVTWIAVAGGNSEKVVAGCIITSMLIASIALIVYILRSRAALTKAP